LLQLEELLLDRASILGALRAVGDGGLRGA
jgi:hypothetical protein